MAIHASNPVSTLDYAIRRFKQEHGEHEMIGKSPAMQNLYTQIDRAGPSDASTLITGPSGTGKELIARAIHRIHYEKKKRAIINYRGTPFIVVNSASIPDDLLESTLFGHMKGAFTGAERDTPGRFELADGGILYLDEIGDLSLRHQAKVLRAVEEGEVSRLGSGIIKHINVRMVTATNKNLERLIEEGQFREDLYYRISVIPLEAPPLSQREGDVRLLTEYFMLELARKYKRIKHVAPDGYQFLEVQPWRGHVRQLRNFLEGAFVMCLNLVMDSEYFNEYAEGKPGFVTFAARPALAVSSDTINMSIESSVARALAMHYDLHAQAKREDTGVYKEKLRQIGELIRRLERMGENLSAAQNNSQNPNINPPNSTDTEQHDYFSHRFYQDASLNEIVLHVARERYRIKQSLGAAARSLGVNPRKFAGWILDNRNPRLPKSGIIRRIYIGDYPIIEADSFYGTATRAEIERDILIKRYKQSGFMKVQTQDSLLIGARTLSRILENVEVEKIIRVI